MNISRYYLPLLLLALMPFLAVAAPGDGVKEGSITYNVITDDLDPNIAAFMSNTKMTVHFDADNVRVNMDMGMGSVVMLASGKSGKTLGLFDMLGNKFAVMMEEQAGDEEVSVEFPGGTKEIAGYTCKKAVLTMQGTSLTFYVTDKLQVPDLNAQFPVSKLKGYPLQMEINQGPVKMTMIAENVSADKVDSGMFEQVIPDGFQEKTMEEFQKLTGGMGF